MSMVCLTSKVYQMPAAFAEHADQAKAHVAKTLSGVADAAKAAGVPCETLQMIHDHPYQAIVATAKEKGCGPHRDASHGRGRIAAVLGVQGFFFFSPRTFCRL
jgi:hypothetical protein